MTPEELLKRRKYCLSHYYKRRNDPIRWAKHLETRRKWYEANRDRVKANNKAWRERNAEKVKCQYHARRLRPITITRTLLAGAKSRAKNMYDGLPFNLTIDDIYVPDKCPILGIPLVINKSKHAHNSPTLDRLNPAKGYIKGNVAVISHRANSLKNNASLSELKSIVKYMEDHMEKDYDG